MSKYAGQSYRRGRTPAGLLSHNAVSWSKIDAVLARRHLATYDELCGAALGHEPGTKRYQGRAPSLNAASFIRYCIRNGWLVRAKS